jgi:hypothetical protein
LVLLVSFIVLLFHCSPLREAVKKFQSFAHLVSQSGTKFGGKQFVNARALSAGDRQAGREDEEEDGQAPVRDGRRGDAERWMFVFVLIKDLSTNRLICIFQPVPTDGQSH